VRFSWSGAGLVFRFRGTGARVRMADAAGFFTVLVDGVPQSSLTTALPEQAYTVAAKLAEGEHTVELYRRTQGSWGVTEVLGVEIDGELLAPPVAPVRRIEMIGDSITCGHGNEGTPPCLHTKDTENHYLTYGAIAARSVSAELSTVAWSGKGIVCGWGATWDCAEDKRLPTYYERALAGDPGAAWDFRWQPHAIVVNLGTNDFSQADDPDATFTSEYVAFLARLRTKNPGAKILCGLGPMLRDPDQAKAIGYIKQAVEQRAAAGDGNVKYIDLTLSTFEAGCQNHPNVASHQVLGAKLEAALRSEMGW
jgi:lysophospholipase L1-like esterase